MGGCPVEHGEVDPSNWMPVSPEETDKLNKERVLSSIPRGGTEGNWVYPSEAMFFHAMNVKGHKPHETDMPQVVTIHNIVNEQCWAEIKRWEKTFHCDCNDTKLNRFVGKPKENSIKAKIRGWMGYVKPFDRHDWTIDRCGTNVRYIIDFYQGSPSPDHPVSCFLDVRPAPDNLMNIWDRVKMSFKTFGFR